ncbi:MAG: iron-sulfur cluster assembly scaffold protein [Nanoarchaeota archaeon]|nr:iron-sulfur cluster assembly scaffold protein [Nanoarchaeota archaeon]
MYSKKTINRFNNPKFSKKIKKYNAVGQFGNPRCGDVMKIYLNVENGVIKDIFFETMGCIAAIAASDAMCELAKGKKLDDALKITDKDIAKKLGELPSIKYHCSVLGTRALRDAIKNYKLKKKK